AKASRWIVNKQYDLTFFVGSCVFTFAAFGLYKIAHHFQFFLNGDSVLITYFVYSALFDQPHIFQTFSRTHLDDEEFQKRRKLYTWGIVGFIAAGLLVVASGFEAHLIGFAALYGSWHIIRQHAGFLKAYKVINDDLDPIDNWLDWSTFYVGMFACFFNDYSGIRGPFVIYGDVKAWFPTLPSFTGETLWTLFLSLLICYGGRQTWRIMEGKSINAPKLLLFSAAMTTHYFVFFLTATPFLVAEALETIYHDVQYHGWMMNYQRKRFPQTKRVVLKWLAVALVYGIVVTSLEIFELKTRGVAIWLFVPFGMLVIYHYYVDGLIWRFRDYPALRKLLLK
ncbi:hypothetical protein L0222_16615, partial [bacterium]|nr:hypothetical protein [bacterium]